MPGGDVLISMSVIVPNLYSDCGISPIADSDLTARFARYDGVDGGLVWTNDYKSPDHCADTAVGIAGVGDGRVYAFDSVYFGDFYEFTTGYVLQYDVDGNLVTEVALANQGYHLLDVQGAYDRVFAAGTRSPNGFIVEIDLDSGDRLWEEAGLWGNDLFEIQGLDVFANGEFAVRGHDGQIKRVAQGQQELWSTAVNGNGELDVGGPSERVAVGLQSGVVQVLDSGGNALWQTPGGWLAVDPSGDVFVGVGDQLEKRAGEPGDLLCAIALPSPVRSLAVDEQGAPVVLDDLSITKYGP